MGTKIKHNYSFRLLISAIIITVFFNHGHAQEYKVRMAFIGNSITQGVYDYGLSDLEVSYATQFGNMMETIYGDSLEIFNAGVSGCTMMKTANPIWNQAVFATALKSVPDICLIMLGTNDSKPDLLASVKERFLDDYLSMIDTFRFRNPNTKFIVCDPTPIWGQHPYSAANPHHDTILVNYTIPLIDSVAKMESTYLLDLHTPLVDSIQFTADSLHPNEAGHKKIAQILFDWFLEKDLIHQVDAGRAYVSTFKQAKSIVADGDSVELTWETIYADSVFFDDVLVETSGSKMVLAENNKVYTLKVKGSKNTSTFPLTVSAYIPVETEIYVSKESNDFRDGLPTILYATFVDQHDKQMSKKTSNITWTVTSGEGSFGEQTDTSVVFIPTATGTIIVEAAVGDVKGRTTLGVNSLSSVLESSVSEEIIIYPNPVKNNINFYIAHAQNKNIQVRIYTLAGKKILEKDFGIINKENTSLTMNVEHLSDGVYLCSIKKNNNVFYGQFVKK